MNKSKLFNRYSMVLLASLFVVLFAQCANNESRFIGLWKWERMEVGDDTPLAFLNEFKFFKGGNVAYYYVRSFPTSSHNGVGEYKLLDSNNVLITVEDRNTWLFSFEFKDSKTMVLTDRFKTKHYYNKVN